MPDVDLAALNGPELRRLLDSARERGQAALSYEILKEMAARRDRQPGLLGRRARGEPRIVAVDLGDPRVRKDGIPPMPAWRPPSEALAAAAATAHAAGAEPPATALAQPAPRAERPPLEDFEAVGAPADAPPAWAGPKPAARVVREPGPTAQGPAAPRRPRSTAIAAIAAAAGAAGGFGVGWVLAGIGHEPAPVSTAPPRALVVASEGPQRPEPSLGTLTASPASDRSAPASGPAATPPQAQPEATAVQTPRDDEAVSAPPQTRAPAAQIPAAQIPAAGPETCASEPTPADRTICADPELRRVQRELRQAYAEALAAHADKALLRKRQLAWRQSRNAIVDPDRLALVYEQRIEKLRAATAATRKPR